MSKNDTNLPSKSKLKELLLLYQESKFDKALNLSKSITSQFPKHQFSWKVLGAVYHQKGNLKKAISANQKAVIIDPQDPDAYNNLGVGLLEIGSFKKAELSFREALVLKPDYSEAYTNLGVVLQKLGKFDEAENHHRKAIFFNPKNVSAYINLGVTLKELYRFEEAVENYDKAIKLNPNSSTAYTNKNFCLNYSANLSPTFIYQQHLEFGKQFGNKQNNNLFALKKRIISKEKLRIGYVSGDFRNHSIVYFFEPLLNYHDANMFETFCYYNNNIFDNFTEIIKNKTDNWRNIFSVSDVDVSNIIKNDNIDILIDLSGHTGQNRLKLFALKPAPIQITWLGYPNTTGLSEIDYRFTDLITDPIGITDKFYTEKLYRLPVGFLCYKGNNSVSLPNNIPQIENRFVTYGSFNNFLKVTPEVIKVWSKILKSSQTSRLILKGSDINQNAFQHIETFAKEGVSQDRVSFYQNLPKISEHLELYNSVDIALDTFPYNGVTTTCEALWMGVPVITLLGKQHASRVGASILTNVGLENFIANDIEGYIEMATTFANKIDLLKKMRKGLRKKMLKSSLCNGSIFAKEIEKAYKAIWAKHLNS